jgi:nucleoside-diphosphate-sugar epimerase
MPALCTSPDIVRYPAQAFVDVNVTGTLNLLETASAAGIGRFVFTSTTSLMISETVRAGKAGGARRAFWLDEDFAPLEPRNIYGATKLAAEQLCRLHSRDHGLPLIILRTGRFFPEEDDTNRDHSGPNTKANEFLNRRLTVEDAAEAHLAALAKAPEIGFGTYIVAAPSPFARADAEALVEDAPAIIAHYFPEAAALYARAGWTLPGYIDRVYDSGLAERELGFRCRTGFADVLAALASGGQLPFAHDPSYVSPKGPRPAGGAPVNRGGRDAEAQSDYGTGLAGAHRHASTAGRAAGARRTVAVAARLRRVRVQRL